MLSVTSSYLALEGLYLPLGAAIQNYATRGAPVISASADWWYGTMTLSGAVFQRTSTAGSQRRRNVHSAQLGPGSYPLPDSHIELIPLHSQLLRESLLVSFPPLINMLKSSGLSYPNEVMHCSTPVKGTW